MRSLLYKCSKCQTYTMNEVCGSCGFPTIIAHPAKYSPDDKYARYRSPAAYKQEN